MTNKFFNKTVSILLTMIFLFGIFPPAVFAGPSSPSLRGEVKGFNGNVFDNSFSRADREINPERWLAEAKLGLSQAIYSWELIARGLYEDPSLFEEAKNSLEKWGGEELEARFSDWLIGRFFGAAAEKTILEFSQNFSDTQKKYSWHLDGEGNVVFDDTTGDPLVIRPDEDGREFSRDIVKWRNDAKTIINASSASHENIIARLFPELLAYIPPEKRESMTALIYETVSVKNNAIKREFENIAAREERIFTSRRTRDIWSLRNKSENEAAKLFTEKLIAETGEICKAGIEELNVRIEQAEAGAGDLALLGEEWLRLYREQFERGLKAWEEAEERFFVRRIEWEQDSFKLFSEGEEVWLSAFKQFEEERKKWELNAKELFGAGEKLFIGLSEDFEKNIADAKKEFELNMAMRIEEGTAGVKALIDMYLTCASTAVSLKETIYYWQKEFCGNIYDPDDPEFIKQISAELKGSEFKFEVSDEILSLHTSYLSYMEKARDSRGRITANYAELLGSGALKDILSPGASSEDFCLDEYQTALVRAKALVLHWERKAAIAEAVENYAADLSAKRKTEAEGLRAWEEAKIAYNNSLAVYEAELIKLNEAGSDIQKQRDVLSAVSLEMQKEEEKLNALYDEYKSFLSLSIYKSENYYLFELNDKYEKLVSGYGLFDKSGEKAVYYGVLLNGLMWGIAEERENKNMERQESLEPLTTLLNLYGYGCETYFLPEARDLCETIFNMPGNFAQNAAKFLVDFEECFFAVPEWLKMEIELWKDAFTGYVSVYAFNNGFVPEIGSERSFAAQNELFLEYGSLVNYANTADLSETETELLNNLFAAAVNKMNLYYNLYNISYIWENIDGSFSEDNKHWREFIDNKYFDKIDYIVNSVSSWKEGIEADAFFSANYYTNRLNDALLLFSKKDLYAPKEDSYHYLSSYIDEFSAVDSFFNSLIFRHTELIGLIDAYELIRLSSGDIKRQLEEKEAAFKAQEKAYGVLREKYLLEAEKFLVVGSVYDGRYGALKKAQNNTDQKRFEYEIQDAIQRWAGTAYLDANKDDLKNAELKLQKARTVLTVLSDLYGNEKTRSFNDPQYDALYAAYEQSFNKKIKTLEVVEALNTAIKEEKTNNTDLYANYQKALYGLGGVDQNYFGYSLPDDLSLWTGKDIITVKDGRLAFSTTGVNQSDADALIYFFNTMTSPENERYEISLYEEALRGLNQRMSVYLTDPEKLKTWSLARDYLICSLMDANGDILYLNGLFSGYGQMTEDGSIGAELTKTWWDSSKESLYTRLKGDSIYKDAKDIYLDAWNELSGEEKADLEFYIILTLTNTNGYSAGFSQVYTQQLYKHAYDFTYYYYRKAYREMDDWWEFFAAPFYREMRDLNKLTLNRISPLYNETTDKVNKWMDELQKNQRLILDLDSAYTASCLKLDVYEKIKTDGNKIEWADINLSLTTAMVKDEDIAAIKTYWETMLNETKNAEYVRVVDALNALLNRAKAGENKSKTAMADYWNGIAATQQKNEDDFLSAVNAYVAGDIDIKTLKLSAEKAYGENAAAWKNHYNNIHADLSNDISLFTGLNVKFYAEFAALGEELTAFTKSAIENRYLAELSARESEWQQTRKDISDKYYDWQNSAALILENGRMDWITSQRKMEDAYKEWFANFQNEYDRVNNEWAQAYLAGLEDKEKWLEQAANAANQASSESFLSLVGTEGERLSRFIDTREPFGIRDSVPQAQALMSELLKSSGIANMYNAFASLTNYSGVISPIVRRGMGGISTWDSALTKTAASDLAKESNSIIADSEAKKLAYNVQLTIDEIVKGLASNVENANKNFRESMDNQFIFNGLWRRTGDDYVKDVVKGSTLFDPVMTKTVRVKGYANYIMEPVKLQVNLEEHNLVHLNSIAINGLVENAYIEVQAIAAEIFGNGEEASIVDGSGEKRSRSPGKFGAHLGYIPDAKIPEGKERHKIFHDEGEGELGRLMSEYIYWSVIDGMGMSEVVLPWWDKRIWDDEGSWFKSPSVRSVGQIAGAVVAAVVTVVAMPATGGLSLGAISGIAAINSASDIVFNSLDVAYGYKSLDEAAFAVGKSYAMNFASGMIASGFAGIGETAKAGADAAANAVKGTTASTIVNKTMLAGTQTITSGVATSIISGITYSGGSFGFSSEAVSAGIKGSLSGSLVSMTSAFTTSSLSAINSGHDLSKLTGFNKLNRTDIGKLNDLLGSLAGQGVNYALGNDFTLNVLNLTQFTGAYSSGLLELHFGSEGTSMNLGTGGANVSFDNILASLRGLQVWNVNSKIGSYGEKNDFKALVALRAQYGYGDDVQKSQLFDILKGDVTLNTDANGDYVAKTTLDGNENRVINLTGYDKDMSVEEQFRLAVILGHEAYRDGVITGDNNLETRDATLAHTQMALRMIAGGEKIAIDENLYNDIKNYAAAYNAKDMSLFDAYVDNNYDSSADYWRVIMNANGGVDKVLWDGDNDNATIVEADGTERKVALQTGSKSAALAAAVGNGITKDQMNSIMLKSGLQYNQETKLWYAVNDSAVYTPPQIESPQVKNILQSITESIGNKALDVISSGLNGIKNFFGGLFGKSSDTNEKTEDLKKGNTFTMKDSKENEIQLYLSDKENHALNELLQQTDPALKSLPMMYGYGCNFMAVIAFAQLVTGKALSSEQIISIWNEAEKDPKILGSGGFVQSQNKLAEKALQELGRTDIGLNYGGAMKGKPSTHIGYIIKVDYNTNNSHFVIGDVSKQILWNSDIRNTNTIAKDSRSVYVYAKN